MMKTKQLLLGCLFSLLGAASPAFADLSVHIGIGVPLPPPAPIVEVVPAYGYVRAPGYWAWHHDRYIWVRGRHAWQHERRHFHEGRWARDGHRPGRVQPHRHGHRH